MILAIAAVAFLSATLCARDGGSQEGKQEIQKSTDRVKELQQERIATLKTVAEMESALYRIGRASPEDVLEASTLVCEAELDAAETHRGRVTALTALVEVLKKLEELAKAKKLAAEATEVPVLKAKAKRLAAEIRLERAQAEL